LTFQPLDDPADGGLGEMQRFRGSTQAARFDHSEKCAELPGIEAHTET